MEARELFNQGNLSDALTTLKADIRKAPSNVELRMFLFQLYSFAGEWAKARNQLDAICELAKELAYMRPIYGPVLQLEEHRATVFEGLALPTLFGEPMPWMTKFCSALLKEGQEAADLRAEALDEAEPVAGTIDGEPFDFILDQDSRIGPFFEVYIQECYYWMPLHRVRSIKMEKPHTLHETIWAKAEFRWTNEGISYGMIPVRYPGSDKSGDGLIQLGRKTDWVSLETGEYVGLGQRVLGSAEKDYAILDIREISFDGGES